MDKKFLVVGSVRTPLNAAEAYGIEKRRKEERREMERVNELKDYRLIFKIKRLPVRFTGREESNEFICDTERVVWQDPGARKRSPSRTLIATINGPGRDPFTRSRIPGSDLSVLWLAVTSPCRIGKKRYFWHNVTVVACHLRREKTRPLVYFARKPIVSRILDRFSDLLNPVLPVQLGTWNNLYRERESGKFVCFYRREITTLSYSNDFFVNPISWNDLPIYNCCFTIDSASVVRSDLANSNHCEKISSIYAGFRGTEN